MDSHPATRRAGGALALMVALAAGLLASPAVAVSADPPEPVAANAQPRQAAGSGGGIGVGDLLNYGYQAYKYGSRLLECEQKHVSHDLQGIQYVVELGKCTGQEPLERKINELRDTVDREFGNLNQRMNHLEKMLLKIQRADTVKYARPVFDGTERGFEHVDSLAACINAARLGGGATCHVYGLEGRTSEDVVPDRSVLTDIQRKIVTQQFNTSPEKQARGKGYGDLMREFVGTKRDAAGTVMAYAYLAGKSGEDNKVGAKATSRRSGRTTVATSSLMSNVNRQTREITLALSRYFALQELGLMLRSMGVRPITNVNNYETDADSLRRLARTANEVFANGARASGDEVLSAGEAYRRFGFWHGKSGAPLSGDFAVVHDSNGKRRDDVRVFANSGPLPNDAVMSAWARGRGRIAATGNNWWKIQNVADTVNEFAPYSRLHAVHPGAFPTYWYASGHVRWQENLFTYNSRLRPRPRPADCGWLVPRAAWRIMPGVTPYRSAGTNTTIGVKILDSKPHRPGYKDSWAKKTFVSAARVRSFNPDLDPSQKEWDRVVSTAEPVWQVLLPDSLSGKCSTDYSFGPGVFVRSAESPESNANAPQRLGVPPGQISDMAMTQVEQVPWLMSDDAERTLG